MYCFSTASLVPALIWWFRLRNTSGSLSNAVSLPSIVSRTAVAANGVRGVELPPSEEPPATDPGREPALDTGPNVKASEGSTAGPEPVGMLVSMGLSVGLLTFWPPLGCLFWSLVRPSPMRRAPT